jgi:hypothetical protein
VALVAAEGAVRRFGNKNPEDAFEAYQERWPEIMAKAELADQK